MHAWVPPFLEYHANPIQAQSANSITIMFFQISFFGAYRLSRQGFCLLNFHRLSFNQKFYRRITQVPGFPVFDLMTRYLTYEPMPQI